MSVNTKVIHKTHKKLFKLKVCILNHNWLKTKPEKLSQKRIRRTEGKSSCVCSYRGCKEKNKER